MCILGKFRALLILIILFHLFWAWNVHTRQSDGILSEIEFQMYHTAQNTISNREKMNVNSARRAFVDGQIVH